LNAYRQEDPIEAVRRAGYTELMDSQKAPYSFVYYGQHGTLDYAFASAALQNKVDRAFIWNANSVYPADIPLPEPWLRFSDHDPVVVDLRLRHSTTSD
jgi:predicted extracellular nuclease